MRCMRNFTEIKVQSHIYTKLNIRIWNEYVIGMNFIFVDFIDV